MEHPLVGELSHLTTDELSAKISELNKKLSIAARTGNAHLCNQLRMALESYNTKYQEKLQQSYRDASTNFDDKINIQ
jgi:Skp family chaperone for outer membrane proteins